MNSSEQKKSISQDTGLVNKLRKQIEELQLANLELEGRFQELKKVDILKEEFVAMVSHELKTPLTPIKFQCEMLTEGIFFGELTPKQLGSINEIDRNATRLERLISDILNAQKLDMKKNGI